MPSTLTLLALFFASLTAGLPIHQASQNTTTHIASQLSAHTLAKRTTANPPFDPWEFQKNGHRTDGDTEGDIYRLTKCFCIDTPSKDLPVIFGQHYGNYYGFDYYNYHLNKSYAFSWTCDSSELENLNQPISDYLFVQDRSQNYLAPVCLAWMEEEINQRCWDTGDGNTFCASSLKGKDYYSWNGQWREVHNHPAKDGTTKMPSPQLNEECQRMCQTIPCNTPGYMQDTLVSDHENKIILRVSQQCQKGVGPLTGSTCDKPGEHKKTKPKTWETWNYIETYTDQADMCKGCA